MNSDRQLPRLPYDEPDSDPATRAFTRLEGEMAMMRRAVEHLATEKSEIDIPDYSKTLGEMANRLVSIERQPAMQMTPEDFEARMTAAAERARRDDEVLIVAAKRDRGEAIRDLRAIIGTANSIYEQKTASLVVRRRRLACRVPPVVGASGLCRAHPTDKLAPARTHRRAHRS
ncbi:MAG: hypothetical protein H2055_01510 [Sphingopyxis sp.]|nr:hypothetical protein [Sphingopyxis sp.]